VSKDINDLHPNLQPVCILFLKDCSAAGLDARLIFTYRTPAEQDAMYAQGRTMPGPKVTSLRGTQSKHCYTIAGKPAAKAFDFGIFEGGRYISDGKHPSYTKAGELGEFRGLVWGGRWKVPFDPSHLQLHEE
jgi:peptidoglycan L-alanyl-D-glutamate endopeptidase CwlK